ncbi:unnamed protein product [Fraxinus pennsylvanica]|uniref:Uncharacterized protein n=1 Tax=Fraxinus pennsylvanica TaxID=56036 RepID=A0AAD2E6Y3_9LAMI|nr:unnamed protein product [Fraxinus pennsylvanica]
MPSWGTDGKLITLSSSRHNLDNMELFRIYTIKPNGTNLRMIHAVGFEEEMERLKNHPYGDLHLEKLDGSVLRRLKWNGYENGMPIDIHRKKVDYEGNADEIELDACLWELMFE